MPPSPPLSVQYKFSGGDSPDQIRSGVIGYVPRSRDGHLNVYERSPARRHYKIPVAGTVNWCHVIRGALVMSCGATTEGFGYISESTPDTSGAFATLHSRMTNGPVIWMCYDALQSCCYAVTKTGDLLALPIVVVGQDVVVDWANVVMARCESIPGMRIIGIDPSTDGRRYGCHISFRRIGDDLGRSSGRCPQPLANSHALRLRSDRRVRGGADLTCVIGC